MKERIPNKIIAYDLGTGGNKASLFSAEGENLASSFIPYQTFYPGTGLHEQRPEDWWTAVVRSTQQLKEQAGFASSEIAGIAISGHSLGCVPLDGKGNLLREKTPIWSDSRAAEQTAKFFTEIDPDEWYMTTGNGFPPECYTAFKVMWYRDNEPEMFGGTQKILGTKDYINFLLTGEIATDYSYASGSGVYDLKGWSYSSKLIEASGLSPSLFPEPRPSTDILGGLSESAAEELGLAGGIPVVCGGVDNSCMALGAGNISRGKVYTSLGSSSWIAVSSEEPVLDPEAKPFVFTHVVPGLFTSAVSIFSAGSSFAWVKDVLCKDLTGRTGEEKGDVYEFMTREAQHSPLGANGLVFNPSLAGGSSQEENPAIRGGYGGIDLRHSRADMIRAAMEGIAMNLGAVFSVLREKTELEDTMLLVGGGSKSPLWRQIFADIYEMAVIKTNIGQDAGSLGAAAIGAVGTGLWEDFSRIQAVHREESRDNPRPQDVKKYRKLKELFELHRKQSAELGKQLNILWKEEKGEANEQ